MLKVSKNFLHKLKFATFRFSFRYAILDYYWPLI